MGLCVPAGLCGGHSCGPEEGCLLVYSGLWAFWASARSQSVAVLAENCGFSGIHNLGYSLGSHRKRIKSKQDQKDMDQCVYSSEYLWKLWKWIRNKTKLSHIPKVLLDLFLFIYRYTVLINLDHHTHGSVFVFSFFIDLFQADQHIF